jgi:hypothetical protein
MGVVIDDGYDLYFAGEPKLNKLCFDMHFVTIGFGLAA